MRQTGNLTRALSSYRDHGPGITARRMPPTAILLLLLAMVSNGTLIVQARSTSTSQWKDYPTRIVDSLKDFSPSDRDTGLSPYGGLSSLTAPSTGYFRALQRNGRWWLVDPSGTLFLHRGIVSITPGTSATNKAALSAKFASSQTWADSTTRMISAHGFNGAGAWSSTSLLSAAPRRLAYTMIWNFMSGYGKIRGGTYVQPGHTGYPNDCIFAFDTAFARYCDSAAQQLAATSTDPWLVGHFSDNELPFPSNALNLCLQLVNDDPSHIAAAGWLTSRKGGSVDTNAITATDQADFLGYMAEAYFRTVSTAIKKYDPNHLYLGSRINYLSRASQLYAAAGKYADVVSLNYYGAWTPDTVKLRSISAAAGKPVMITEFYVKGEDSGLPNTTGAGWNVHTQQDRGWFYQNYTLALLQSRVCVGWHWFKYMDNDTADLSTDPSNRDANKGVVSIVYQPYQPLLSTMRQLNERTFRLVDYFDRSASAVRAPARARRSRDLRPVLLPGADGSAARLLVSVKRKGVFALDGRRIVPVRSPGR